MAGLEKQDRGNAIKSEVIINNTSEMERREVFTTIWEEPLFFFAWK